MNTIDFGKVITAMVTPFDNKGDIDKEAVVRLVEHLIRTGTDSIVVAGTTGESPTLDPNEKIELFHLVKQTAGERIKIIANVGDNNTRKTMQFIQKVEEFCGVDGILVVAPYYNKPNQEGLRLHFETIALNTNLPIILYNIPGRTGVNIEAETTIRLSSIPNIVAIKESSGNLDQMSEIIEGTDESFKLYNGDDNLTLPVVAIGGYGVISVASHLFGENIKKMIENKDAGLHRTLLPIFKALFIDTNPTGIKYLLSQNGLINCNLRLPLTDTTVLNKQKLLKVYTDTLNDIRNKNGVTF